MSPNFVCVYCGSNLGCNSEYQRSAKKLGQALVDRNLGLVYGGAQIGLMGAVADSVLEAGGERANRRTLYDAIAEGSTVNRALLTREREPDAPNYTPRISGLDARVASGQVRLHALVRRHLIICKLCFETGFDCL